MRRHKKNNSRVQMIVGLSICVLLIMTVGYAAFSTNLNITAKGNVKNMKASMILKKKIVTSGDGLYKDTYEDNHYIYRGAAPNNYITFNGEKAGWRIMSVEANGTLKIVKSQSIGTYIFDGSRTTGYCSGTQGCNAWLAIENYKNGGISGKVDKDAEVNTYLNSAYYGTLSNEAKNQMTNEVFNVGPMTPRNENLAEQITMEKGITWQGKIGLISGSEYIRANSNNENCGNLSLNNQNRNICLTSNYLPGSFSNIPNSWALSVTPSASSNNSIVVFSTTGVISYDITNSIGGASDDHNGVVPVLYLRSDITLTGEGTETNPYTIG